MLAPSLLCHRADAVGAGRQEAGRV